MTEPLSPTAQLVMDAYHDAPILGGLHGGDALGVAAAIRALVDQTAPLDRRSRRQCNIHRAQLAIAAELEGQANG